MAHDEIKNQYDQVQAEGLYEEGMARMALYHRHCQDPVIFRALGDVGGKSLLDLACGDGFYTRKFRRAGADPVVGVDLSPQQIAKARRIEEREPLGIEYLAAESHPDNLLQRRRGDRDGSHRWPGCGGTCWPQRNREDGDGDLLAAEEQRKRRRGTLAAEEWRNGVAGRSATISDEGA